MIESIKKKAFSLSGFSLIELIFTMAIIGILTAIALPNYRDYVDRSDNATAMADIFSIGGAVEEYYAVNMELPSSLTEIGAGDMKDPWDNEYQYFPFTDNTNIGSMRKDKNLVPVNSDYDLCSMGKDGNTLMAFTAKAAQDDIVRANNGGYVGLARDY